MIFYVFFKIKLLGWDCFIIMQESIFKEVFLVSMNAYNIMLSYYYTEAFIMDWFGIMMFVILNWIDLLVFTPEALFK